MSQFNLTPEEDQLLIDALQAKAAQYMAMFGVSDAAMASLLEKLSSQLPTPVAPAEPVVEAAPVVEQAEETVAEVPAEE